MKIVLAPDKFKDSLTAAQVCDAMREGIRRARPDATIDPCPISDGGEGFVDTMSRAMPGAERITRRVTGPLPEMKVDATFALLRQAGPSGPGPTAIIEMSAASGLHILPPDERDPLATTTFGTGELIRIALEEFGATQILLGIGGSATCDAGIGAAQACGLPVLLEGGEPTSLTEPLCGRDMDRVILIKHGRGDRLGNIAITVACDVTNPLFGGNGAAWVYGPQKGATPHAVAWLDRSLEQLARRTGKLAEAKTPGAGAAGGLGFALLAFFGATLHRGIDLVMDATNLRERLIGADLCFMGEGQLDGQSICGKALSGVYFACRDANVPCVAICGSIAPGVLELGFEAHAINSMTNAAELVAITAEQVVRRRSTGRSGNA